MKWFILSVIVWTCSISYAHDYFFAFAEMQYSEDNERFEVTIRATGHDIEDYLAHLGHPIPKLEKVDADPLAKQTLLQLIQNEFQIKTDDKLLALELVGFEVNNKDEAVFYLTSKKMEKPAQITVSFKLLMSFYPEQQNKLTLFTSEGKSYFSFLQHEKTRTIELKDN